MRCKMPDLRISVTTIEQFRRYIAEEIPEEQLQQSIKGIFEPRRYVALGKAIDAIIEQPKKYYQKKHNLYVYDDLTFERELIDTLWSKINPNAAWQVKITRDFTIAEKSIEVVGKADQLDGRVVIENKTTWSGYDPMRYFESYQWRYYLLMFGLPTIKYNVFELYDGKDGIEIHGLYNITFDTYPAIERDCRALLTQFVGYIYDRQLQEYLQPKSLPITKPELKQDTTMKIQKIQIKNILGIENFEMTPDAKLTVVGGQNGAGKTSLINAINAALGGGHDATLLRNGADKGEVVIVFDDKSSINKIITESGSTVKMKDKAGKLIPGKPQTMIDALTNKSKAINPVNPIEFLTLKPELRTKLLLESLPLEINTEKLVKAINGYNANIDEGGHPLDVIANIRKQIYEERTGVNRVAKEKQATVKQLEETITNIESDVEQLKVEIAQLEEKKDMMQQKKAEYLEDLRKDYEQQKAQLEESFKEQFEPVNESLISKRAKVEGAISATKTKQIIEQTATEAREQAEYAEKLTEYITNLDALVNEMQAELPIAGLEIKDGLIYKDGVLFDRLNTQKQMELAVEISRRKLGELEFMIVDGIERLDTEHFAAFKEVAEKSGIQMLLTKVADNAELTIE